MFNMSFDDVCRGFEMILGRLMSWMKIFQLFIPQVRVVSTAGLIWWHKPNVGTNNIGYLFKWFLNLCMTECLWTNFPGIAGDNIPQAARRLKSHLNLTLSSSVENQMMSFWFF